MVFTGVELVIGLPTLEIMLHHQARSFKLAQHAVHRGQTDFFARLDQPPVDIVGGQVFAALTFEDLEDTLAGVRDLESSSLQMSRFHRLSPPMLPTEACRVSRLALTCRAGFIVSFTLSAPRANTGFRST